MQSGMVSPSLIGLAASSPSSYSSCAHSSSSSSYSSSSSSSSSSFLLIVRLIFLLLGKAELKRPGRSEHPENNSVYLCGIKKHPSGREEGNSNTRMEEKSDT